MSASWGGTCSNGGEGGAFSAACGAASCCAQVQELERGSSAQIGADVVTCCAGWAGLVWAGLGWAGPGRGACPRAGSGRRAAAQLCAVPSAADTHLLGSRCVRAWQPQLRVPPAPAKARRAAAPSGLVAESRPGLQPAPPAPASCCQVQQPPPFAGWPLLHPAAARAPAPRLQRQRAATGPPPSGCALPAQPRLGQGSVARPASRCARLAAGHSCALGLAQQHVSEGGRGPGRWGGRRASGPAPCAAPLRRRAAVPRARTRACARV
jgi:hypothetical protein